MYNGRIYMYAGPIPEAFIPQSNVISHSIIDENDMGLHFSATTCQGKVLPGLPRRRDQAELLEHAEPVYLVPDFHELVVGYAGDGDSCQSYLLAGRGVRTRCQDITGVGASTCHAHNYLVPFSDQVINRDMKVRESFEDPGDPSFVFFAGANLGKARIMEDEVGGIELIKDGKIARVPDLLNETTNERLVVFG